MKKIICCFLAILILSLSVLGCSSGATLSNSKMQTAVRTLLLYKLAKESLSTTEKTGNNLNLADVAKKYEIGNGDCEIIYCDYSNGYGRFAVYSKLSYRLKSTSLTVKEDYLAFFLVKDGKIYVNVKNKIDEGYLSFVSLKKETSDKEVKKAFTKDILAKMLDSITALPRMLEELPIT